MFARGRRVSTECQCGAGGLMARVTLKGTIVELQEWMEPSARKAGASVGRKGMKKVLPIAVVAATLVASISPAQAGESHMLDYAAEEGLQMDSPEPDEALILFLRTPTRKGALIKSTVYEALDDGTVELLSVQTRGTYLVHPVNPGKHVFAVVGESADFIEVHAQGGHIYPVITKPRIGAWKARFSLFSGCPNSEDWSNLAEWLTKSRKVTLKRDEADAWFSAHGNSVRGKVEKYWPKWLEKPNRPEIQPKDGVKTVDELR